MYMSVDCAILYRKHEKQHELFLVFIESSFFIFNELIPFLWINSFVLAH